MHYAQNDSVGMSASFIVGILTLRGYLISTILTQKARLIVIGAAISMVVLIGCGVESDAEYPIVLTTSLINEGRTVYQTNCASCHGDATTPPPLPGAPRHTADGHTWHHGDQQLVGWVLDGVPTGQTMPKFRGTLSESDAQAAIAYIKTFWPNEIIQQQSRGMH